MAFYDKYPYTDFHELNLDWIIEVAKDSKRLAEETNKSIEETTRKILNEMIADGTLSNLINDTLFEQLNNDINKIAYNMNHNSNFFFVEPAIVGNIPINSPFYLQGLTGDNNNLYTVAYNPNTNVAQFYRYNLNTNVSTALGTGYGHSNCLSLYNNKLYASSLSATNKDGYQYIGHMNLSNNTVVSDVDAPTGAWNIAFYTDYNNVSVFALLDQGNHSISIYAEQVKNTRKRLPLCRIPLKHIGGVIQGMTIVGGYIYVVESNTLVYSDNVGTNCVHVYELNGSEVCTICLTGSFIREVEDVHVIGNIVYVNDANGNLYKFDKSKYVRPASDPEYTELSFNSKALKVNKWLYINANGSETTKPTSNGSILYSFRMSPYYYPSIDGVLTGWFNYITTDLDYGYRFPVTFNPSTRSLIIDGAWCRGNYTYNVHLEYTLSSDADNYIYTLDESHSTGSYRNTSGALTVLTGSALYNQVFQGNCYINELHSIGGATATYSYNYVNYS